MKKLLFIFISLIACVALAGRGGGYGGGSRSSSYGSSGRSSGSSYSSGSTSRSSGYGKSSSSGKSSSYTPSFSSRSNGYGKSSSYNYSSGMNSRQATQAYIYHNTYVPTSVETYYWHPLFGFGYYRSDMSLMEMYMWHQIFAPHRAYAPSQERGICHVDRDCMVSDRCDLTLSPGTCMPRNSGNW